MLEALTPGVCACAARVKAVASAAAKLWILTA
jgi:hypothetical protein